MKLNSYNNLLELFFDQYKKQDKNNIFLTNLGNPKHKLSWEKTYLLVNHLSNQISKDIKLGDRCVLISENRPEWLISDLAIMLAGGISVPSYTTYTTKDYEYIIKDCEPSVLIVSNNIQFNKIKDILDYKQIKKIISFDRLENLKFQNYLCIEDIINKKDGFEIFDSEISLKRSDPACIIYTSGTQGNPKGVILSHGGILSNCEGGYELLKSIISKDMKFLTWLPLSHSYEHTVQFIQIAVGAKVFYAESIDKLLKNISDCSPDIMTAVPRFYQNLYQKISTAFSKAKGIKKFLVENTVNLGSKKFNRENMNIKDKILNKICDMTVRSKIKKQFGGSLKTFVSGGGALDPEIGIFLNSIGLPTLQGYGLTETSPVVSCNPIEDIRIDTVGIPFRCNNVKIAEDGEILVKGENVMLGYWNKKAETDKVLVDGWLHTGDIGKFVNGFLKITDRKKDILITPGGDNISPVKVETALNNSNYIDQSLVYGDNKPYLVALLVLNSETDINEKNLSDEIEKINKNLTKIEKIKKFFVIKEKFSIENGMMTPTLKLKRYKIINIYKNNFEDLYKNN
ncbi:long-chain fatty acid--CoA ligase [Candidatus Pelagibacter sp.]|nr:long-chain fatty acid--CoA ligase [Candidatus Pelagibacter sp.]